VWNGDSREPDSVGWIIRQLRRIILTQCEAKKQIGGVMSMKTWRELFQQHMNTAQAFHLLLKITGYRSFETENVESHCIVACDDFMGRLNPGM